MRLQVGLLPSFGQTRGMAGVSAETLSLGQTGARGSGEGPSSFGQTRGMAGVSAGTLSLGQTGARGSGEGPSSFGQTRGMAGVSAGTLSLGKREPGVQGEGPSSFGQTQAGDGVIARFVSTIRSGKEVASLSPPPLRTVRVAFTTHSSSRPAIDSLPPMARPLMASVLVLFAALLAASNIRQNEPSLPRPVADPPVARQHPFGLGIALSSGL